MTEIYCKPYEATHETADYLTWERDGEEHQACTDHDPGDPAVIDGWFSPPPPECTNEADLPVCDSSQNGVEICVCETNTLWKCSRKKGVWAWRDTEVPC